MMFIVELAVKDSLNEQQAVPAFMEVPETPPAAYIVVEKEGSSVSNHIHTDTVTVLSHAASLYEAILLNERLKPIMAAMVTLPNVSRVELEEDYQYTDPSTKTYRYKADYDITYMEGAT